MVRPGCTVTGLIKEKMYEQFVGNNITFLNPSTRVCNIRNCKPQLNPQTRDGDMWAMCMAIAGINISEIV